MEYTVKEKCVSSGKGHNFDPCMVYYNPDATREAWCCEAGFQPELNVRSKIGISWRGHTSDLT
jgi:hypothetical protein